MPIVDPFVMRTFYVRAFLCYGRGPLRGVQKMDEPSDKDYLELADRLMAAKDLPEAKKLGHRIRLLVNINHAAQSYEEARRAQTEENSD